MGRLSWRIGLGLLALLAAAAPPWACGGRSTYEDAGASSGGNSAGAGGSQSTGGAAGTDGSIPASASPDPEICPNGKPRPVTTLASGQHSPGSVAVDGANVYWVNAGTAATNYGDYKVMKVPISGGTPVTLASGLRGISATAIDAKYLYATIWGNFVAASQDPALDLIVRVPLEGGPLETLATGELWPMGIAVDAMDVYWANGGNLTKMLLSGGTHVTLATGQDFPGSLVVDDANLYWANGGTTGRPQGYATVMKVAKNGGSPVTLVTASDIANPGIAVDATTVYWTFAVYDMGDTGEYSRVGTVNKVPIAGGPSVTLASGLPGPGSIAVDATDIYWGNWGTGQPATNASLMRMPTLGGTPTVLVGAMLAAGIALDAANVYFTDPDHDTVMVVPKSCPLP